MVRESFPSVIELVAPLKPPSRPSVMPYLLGKSCSVSALVVMVLMERMDSHPRGINNKTTKQRVVKHFHWLSSSELSENVVQARGTNRSSRLDLKIISVRRVRSLILL
jgi:hypothetical protein